MCILLNVHNLFVFCPDVSSLAWTVQVELLVDAVQETSALLILSLPELHSEQTVQSRFLPGKTRNRFTLNINSVV